MSLLARGSAAKASTSVMALPLLYYPDRFLPDFSKELIGGVLQIRCICTGSRGSAIDHIRKYHLN